MPNPFTRAVVTLDREPLRPAPADSQFAYRRRAARADIGSRPRHFTSARATERRPVRDRSGAGKV